MVVVSSVVRIASRLPLAALAHHSVPASGLRSPPSPSGDARGSATTTLLRVEQGRATCLMRELPPPPPPVPPTRRQLLGASSSSSPPLLLANPFGRCCRRLLLLPRRLLHHLLTRTTSRRDSRRRLRQGCPRGSAVVAHDPPRGRHQRPASQVSSGNSPPPPLGPASCPRRQDAEPDPPCTS